MRPCQHENNQYAPLSLTLLLAPLTPRSSVKLWSFVMQCTPKDSGVNTGFLLKSPTDPAANVPLFVRSFSVTASTPVWLLCGLPSWCQHKLGYACTWDARVADILDYSNKNRWVDHNLDREKATNLIGIDHWEDPVGC
jgi:hypothetical protein